MNIDFINNKLTDPNVPFSLDEIREHVLSSKSDKEKHPEFVAMLEELFEQIRGLGNEIQEDVSAAIRANLSPSTGVLTPEQLSMIEKDVIEQSANYARERAQRHLVLMGFQAVLEPFIAQGKLP